MQYQIGGAKLKFTFLFSDFLSIINLNWTKRVLGKILFTNSITVLVIRAVYGLDSERWLSSQQSSCTTELDFFNFNTLFCHKLRTQHPFNWKYQNSMPIIRCGAIITGREQRCTRRHSKHPLWALERVEKVSRVNWHLSINDKQIKLLIFRLFLGVGGPSKI